MISPENQLMLDPNSETELLYNGVAFDFTITTPFEDRRDIESQCTQWLFDSPERVVWVSNLHTSPRDKLTRSFKPEVEAVSSFGPCVVRGLFSSKSMNQLDAAIGHEHMVVTWNIHTASSMRGANHRGTWGNSILHIIQGQEIPMHSTGLSYINSTAQILRNGITFSDDEMEHREIIRRLVGKEIHATLRHPSIIRPISEIAPLFDSQSDEEAQQIIHNMTAIPKVTTINVPDRLSTGAAATIFRQVTELYPNICLQEQAIPQVQQHLFCFG